MEQAQTGSENFSRSSQHRSKRAALDAALAEVDAARESVAAAHGALADLVVLLDRLHAACAVPRDERDVDRCADLVDEIRTIALHARHEGITLLDGTLTGLVVDLGPAGQPVHIDIDDVAAPLALLTEEPSPQTVRIVVAALRGRTARAAELIRRLDDAAVVLAIIVAERATA